ncbi:kinesin-like protein KIF27 isoform X4 [Mytilus californianus]|uniref:kinesin-like protein KIF27 isoform X3 n=1 Tax=Mytilus californianus TaxID=6549 RepID=UPI0022459E17|nr:kinesin-like protein KIF27 isoform X3 [Mytilus californianus]XP_052067158.1 kinesin-like protein KIF27 isoform X4 [Mytilus californianus]
MSMMSEQEVNVRVAVRVRPLLPKEKIAGEEMCVRIIPATNQLVLGKDRAFTFDHVLSSKTTQDEVYKSCIDPLVNGIFEGYNATVFAYGQTGSGKTYTVGDGISSFTDEEYGIIPRALKAIFDNMQSNTTTEFSVKVSYIEIYKEELQDLLDVDTSSKELHVREDDQGNTVIIGAREVECESLDEIMSLLESGSSIRHTGSTQMNEHSSRSHSIFTVIVGQRWVEADVMAGKRKPSESNEIIDDDITHNMFGKFHFVDLAGSERAHRTGNVGDRFKESVHINSGLLALGNVISALGDPKKKSTHIPYRESKITRLLKDSLGGNAQTLMICCISPSTSNFDESLNALKYANRAKNIKNKPIINRDVQSIRFEEMQCEIMALREELVKQRTTLLSNGGQGFGLGDPVHMEKYVHDAQQLERLEKQVVRLQTECSHYKMIAEEAYKQLIEIQNKDILSQSQDIRLKDWLDLMEEIKNKVPATLSREEMENETIRNLTALLTKCKEDLKSDEEIFAEKSKEHNNMTHRLQELEAMVEEKDRQLIQYEDTRLKQEQQLIEQHMKIEELQKAIKDELSVDNLMANSSLIDDEAVTVSAPPIVPPSDKRPKSVPVQLTRRPDTANGNLRPLSRNIKTSPALFTLDRVMKSFRARSQLLVSQLEDSDEVMHNTYVIEEEGETAGTSQKFDAEEPVQDSQEHETGKFVRKGTFKVKRGRKAEENKENVNNTDVPVITVNREVITGSMSSSAGGDNLGVSTIEAVEDSLRKSANTQRMLKESRLKLTDAHTKMRDLSINIRLKEQLIRELVKTGKDADLMNKKYADKIKSLEKERMKVKRDLQETQSVLQELEAKQETTEKVKLTQEYKKRMETAKARMSAISKKQKETENIANFSIYNEKKIQDLELAVDRMKQTKEHVTKKLKDESERKLKLEREMQKETQKVKELEIKNEQQQKILKRKNEEIAAVQRKLRSGGGSSLPPINIEDHDKIEDQKKWLDNEVEKVLQQKRQMEELQEELKKRETIVAKKEAMLAEKSEIEFRRMRSSQIINKNILSVSMKLDTLDKRLEEKTSELSKTPTEQQQFVKEEMSKFQEGRDKLARQRTVLENKLREGRLLSGQEERRIIELDEGIDALDAAIEYKTDAINSRQLELRHSQILSKSEDHVMNKLNSLTTTETRALMMKYFNKVVACKDAERRLNLHCSEMEVKQDEQERLIRELEAALQRSAVEVDRRITKQTREYEQKIQMLMRQLADSGTNVGNSGGFGPEIDEKMQRLEKELYYYKKTSRELKKRLRELEASGALPHQDDLDIRSSVQSSINETDHAAGASSNHIGSREPNREPRLLSARSEKQNSRPSSAKSGANVSTTVTPVKLSRKDLRQIPDTELALRRSNLSQGRHSIGSPPPQDSLDGGLGNSNPWG